MQLISRLFSKENSHLLQRYTLSQSQSKYVISTAELVNIIHWLEWDQWGEMYGSVDAGLTNRAKSSSWCSVPHRSTNGSNR